MPNIRIGNGALSLSAFYDFGMIWHNRDTSHGAEPGASNRRSLGSLGFGFKLGAPDDFLLRTDLAWARSGPATSDTSAHSLRLWLQAIRWF
jgi:hemolysin activation/secretion protein